MSVTVLRVGSKGEPVRRLQEGLNRKLAGLTVRVDGDFGNNTRLAVRRFQDEGWLVIDGEAGQCTQNALFDAESYTPIRHQRPFIPQPTDSTCWAAATAMLKRSSVAAVKSSTPADMWNDADGLQNQSGTANWLPQTQRYANAHGLRFYPPSSWTPQAFVGMLRFGPIIVDTLWRANEYSKGKSSPGHMTLVVGVRGDNDQSGGGTSLLVYDPWAPNIGKKWRVSYRRWVSSVSTRTYRLFQ